MLSVQIFDHFVPCLRDVNGKVTLMALGVLCDILPCVGPHMTNVVSLTVSAVASNLASSNPDIHDMAAQTLDQFILLVGTFRGVLTIRITSSVGCVHVCNMIFTHVIFVNILIIVSLECRDAHGYPDKSG